MSIIIVQPSMKLYGGAELVIEKLANWLVKHGTETKILTTEIKKAIKYYQKEKIKTSLLYGIIAIFGLPILLILGRQTSRSIKGGKEWIDKNKTI